MYRENNLLDEDKQNLNTSMLLSAKDAKKYSLNEYSENEIFNDAQAYLVKILNNVKQSKLRKISCNYIADPKNENSYIICFLCYLLYLITLKKVYLYPNYYLHKRDVIVLKSLKKLGYKITYFDSNYYNNAFIIEW